MNDGVSNFLTGIGQIAQGVAPIAGTGAQVYGQQNAAEAVSKANQGAIDNQRTFLGNIGDIYSPYTTAGAGATKALTAAEGIGGQPADYSNFLNMPGYQFAVQQGTQALQRQAAASGSAFTPNTLNAVGQYVTGTAMQDYNTYIQQLQSTAGMGATAANQLGNITYNTGANISQLMANTGQSQAGMYTGVGQTVGGALGAGGYDPYGGYGGAVSGVANGIGNIAKGVGSLFNGSGVANAANTAWAQDAAANSGNWANYTPPPTDYSSAINDNVPMPSFDFSGFDDSGGG
jgi:hypothetical protein